MPGAQLKNPETNGCFTLDRERRALPPMNPALSRKSPEYGRCYPSLKPNLQEGALVSPRFDFLGCYLAILWILPWRVVLRGSERGE